MNVDPRVWYLPWTFVVVEAVVAFGVSHADRGGVVPERLFLPTFLVWAALVLALSLSADRAFAFLPKLVRRLLTVAAFAVSGWATVTLVRVVWFVAHL